MNDLAVQNFSVLQKQASAMAASGFFADAKSEAQAIVKIMAGAELGLGPFASMSGIFIIKGRPALGANIIATLIKNDPRYNYRVLEHDATICTIQFYENGEVCGNSEFTVDDAQKAGTQNMAKFPKNMLFARAISNGAKWYTPGIFGGAPVYTPEELGVSVDGEGDIIVDSVVIESTDEYEEKLNPIQFATKAQYDVFMKIPLEKEYRQEILMDEGVSKFGELTAETAKEIIKENQ